MEINGKVALVTGGGSGIGRATALRLAREGAKVVIADVDDAGGDETVAQIRAAGGAATFVHADVTDEAGTRAMVEAAESAYGGLDILHNNAGIVTPRPRYPDAAPDQWRRVVDVNLTGVILGTQAALPALRRRGGGAIVNTASIAGLMPWPADPVYSATKGGVVLFTRSLAPLKDEAGITVNCVCPAVVDTPLVEKARAALQEEATVRAMEGLQFIPPEEVADAVVELITSGVTGMAMRIPQTGPRELV